MSVSLFNDGTQGTSVRLHIGHKNTDTALTGTGSVEIFKSTGYFPNGSTSISYNNFPTSRTTFVDIYDTNCSPSTTYTYTVRHWSGSSAGSGFQLGDEAATITTQAAPIQPPGAPATPNCYASRSGSTANVSWDNVGSSGMQRFRDGAYIGDQNGSFSFSEARGQTTTGYQVRAFNSNSAGTTYSNYSNTASVFTNDIPAVPNITSPASGAVTKSTGSVTAAATVSDPNGANCFARFRWSSNDFASFTEVDGSTVGSGGSSVATLSGLPQNASIRLNSRTYDGAEFSGFGNEVQFFTNRTPGVPSITSPANGAATLSTGSLAVAATVTDPDGGNVNALFRWSTNNFSTSTDVTGTTVASGGSSTATLTGLPANSTIQLRAFGYDTALYSAPHEISFFTNRIPSVPTGVLPSGSINTITPLLRATVSDPDGQSVKPFFQVATDAAFTAVVFSGYGATVATGTQSSLRCTTQLNSSAQYYVRALGEDPLGAQSAYATGVGFVTPSTITSSFVYTGGVQTFVVPPGVTSIMVDASGAAGGDWTGATYLGGRGGRTQGAITVTPAETLNLYVGGAGAFTGTTAFNGGGSSTSSGAGGGGGTDVRRGGTALTNRVAVAAGGGGAGEAGVGGAGGGLTATAALNGAGGGTQTAGGAGSGVGAAGTLGVGGSTSSSKSGAGGGGYYGGGGGGTNFGGGGGSALVPSGGTTTADYRAGSGIVSLTYSRYDDTVNPAPPTAPTVTAPVDGVKQRGAVTAAWTYNPTIAGQPQGGYTFSRTKAGVTQYWNGTAFQTASVVVSTATTGIAFGSADWSSGTYTYQVSTSDIYGQASPFSVARTITILSGLSMVI